MSNQNEQHWIARVCDSINDYDEVQTAYFDGTQNGAEFHFGCFDRCPAIARFTRTRADRERYQITMAANPILLQDA